MVSSNSRRGSKLLTSKPIVSPKELVARFLELKRLRKRVYELEQRAPIERCAIDARTGQHGDANDREER
jgi:hypothetical protein